MLTPAERYIRDPVFRTIVDMLTVQIEEANYTPTELREAVILAAIHYYERRSYSVFMDGDDYFRKGKER